MKVLNPVLADNLASGVTTHCLCTIVTRQDGAVFGFTDHDRDLVCAGVTCLADSGLSASTFKASLGGSVDTLSAAGALSAGTITERDLARGLWDGAAVTVWFADWNNTARREMIFSGEIGEVSRGPAQFTAELRSLMHRLNRSRGRLFGATCDAAFGDARCKINATASAYRGTGTLTASARRVLTVSGIEAYALGWFQRGLLTWTSGVNAGARCEVKQHYVESGAPVLALAEPMSEASEAGDTFTVIAGCDKSIGACKGFGNSVNFRGFPHIPGNDYATAYPNRDDGNDGGSLFT